MIVVFPFEAHDLALQPRQPMKRQQLPNPHGMRPLKMPSQQPSCIWICPVLRGPDGLWDRLIDRRELESIPALRLVLLHPLMQLFVVAFGVRVIVDAYPAVERSPQQVVERHSEESLLLFERVQRGSDLEVAAGLEFERGHQLAFAKSSAPPISCPKVVPDFKAIVDTQFVSVLDRLHIGSMTTISNLEALRLLVSELEGLAGQPAA